VATCEAIDRSVSSGTTMMTKGWDETTERWRRLSTVVRTTLTVIVMSPRRQIRRCVRILSTTPTTTTTMPEMYFRCRNTWSIDRERESNRNFRDRTTFAKITIMSHALSIIRRMMSRETAPQMRSRQEVTEEFPVVRVRDRCEVVYDEWRAEWSRCCERWRSYYASDNFSFRFFYGGFVRWCCPSVCLYVCSFVCHLWNLLSHSLGGSTRRRVGAYRISYRGRYTC